MSVIRRLAAILAADVVGFSRLMEADEAGTLAALKARRKDVLDPLVAKHQGRVFKVTGDGVLVEFASAVNAVQCAVELQQAFAMANEGQPEDRRIALRIGVNLGDVMVEGGDLYGDGVNIAARLEALAEPGGILISGTAHDHVGTKVKAGFDDIGPQTLKNIAQPVRAYRVTDMPAVAVATTKPISDKPSIAVLPFTNMSGDPEQEYFSDGITEDIITELSRFRSLFVIARNSSFQYKGGNVDVRRVARELGVRFVLEGGVRRAGGRIRVTAQLIDAVTGSHVWAERYDRIIDDIFKVQDELVHVIVSTLFGRLEDAGAQVAKRKHPESLAAYDYLLRGIEHQQKSTMEHLVQARGLLEKAIEIDPDFAAAYAYLALVDQGQYDFDGSPGLLAAAVKHARKAVMLDDNDAVAHVVLGYAYLWDKQLDKAEFHQLRALALNPNFAHIVAHMGLLSAFLGKAADGADWLQNALRLNPFPPHWYRGMLGMAHYAARQYTQAVASLEVMGDRSPWDRMYAAAAYGQLGRSEAARAQLREYRAMRPKGSILEYAANEPFKNLADLEHLLEGLRKAGLPE
jgi:TolB-like protein